MDNPEAQLVKAAQQGCIDSFGKLYERYHGAVVAIGYAMLGHRETAQDLAQEVFVIACRDMNKLKQPDRFAAWLAGICRNLARQTLRDKGRITPLPMQFDIEEQTEHKDRHLDVLKSALEHLRPSERELIVLRYYDNLPYERIGSVLNCSTRAVNSRLIRAKQKIAKFFHQNGTMGDNHETA